MTEKEESIRDDTVAVWQAAYTRKHMKWSQPKAIRYANMKAYKYLYKHLGKA